MLFPWLLIVRDQQLFKVSRMDTRVFSLDGRIAEAAQQQHGTNRLVAYTLLVLSMTISHVVTNRYRVPLFNLCVGLTIFYMHGSKRSDSFNGLFNTLSSAGDSASGSVVCSHGQLEANRRSALELVLPFDLDCARKSSVERPAVSIL